VGENCIPLRNKCNVLKNTKSITKNHRAREMKKIKQALVGESGRKREARQHPWSGSPVIPNFY
jgi:hypothetical protein